MFCGIGFVADGQRSRRLGSRILKGAVNDDHSAR